YERDSPAAVERALARADIFADRCRRMRNRTIENLVQPKKLNIAEQHARHVEKSRALQEAYAAHQARRSRRIFPRVVARSLIGTKLYEQARRIRNKIVMLLAH